MPWSVVKGGGTCSAGQWAVLKDSDGSTEGCHDTKGDAEAHQAALYANEPGRDAGMADIRQLRADAARDPAHVPAGRARSLPFPAELRAETATRDGKELVHIHGMANTYEQPYEMWDVFGPYKETMGAASGKASLEADPDVVFLTNHRGLALARTVPGTLELAETDGGLSYDAWVNPERQDVKDLVVAIRDGIITESSFAFQIVEGTWNDDFTEYRIDAYDINRGDVSAVNYGANPYTSVAARAREVLADLDALPPGAARAALDRLHARPDITPEPTGRSVALELQLLRLDES